MPADFPLSDRSAFPSPAIWKSQRSLFLCLLKIKKDLNAPLKIAVAVKQKAIALSSIHHKCCVVDSDYMTVDRCTLHLCRNDRLSYRFLLTLLFYKYCSCVCGY